MIKIIKTKKWTSEYKTYFIKHVELNKKINRILIYTMHKRVKLTLATYDYFKNDYRDPRDIYNDYIKNIYELVIQWEVDNDIRYKKG